MRVLVSKSEINKPPTKHDLKSLLTKSTKAKINGNHVSLCKRLQKACYLDKNNQALDSKQRLKKQYSEDGIVLFLGAGVSKCSGIPNWEKLAELVVGQYGCQSYCEFKEAFPNLITQFDWAAYESEKHGKKPFLQALYECLYGNHEFKTVKELIKNIPLSAKSQKNHSCWKDIRVALENNKTLKAVGNLIVHEGKKQKLKKSRLHGVITVCADNLLQIYCQSLENGERVLSTVDRASVGDHHEFISIYHLHGYLDARGENFVNTAKSREFMMKSRQLWPSIVFRESEYYETIGNPSSFVNHTPQSYFQRHNVVFIGTSLEDVNIRRWLYNSFCERVMQRIKYLKELYANKYTNANAEYEAKKESVRHFWLKQRGNLSARAIKAVDLVMSNMGVEVIWFDGKGKGKDEFEMIQEYLYQLVK